MTPKQERFCLEYMVDLNATQAAIRAGYSEATAEYQASRLLSNVKVKLKISELQAKQQERTEVTADMVIKELASIAFADIKDFAKITEHIAEDENGARAYNAVSLALTDSIPLDKRKAIAGIKQGANGIEIKLNDKVKALELIGRHLAMFTDKVDVNGSMVVIQGEADLQD